MRTSWLLRNLRAAAAARVWLLLESGCIICLVLLVWLLGRSVSRSEWNHAVYIHVLQPRAQCLIHTTEAGEDLSEALGRYVPGAWETNSDFLKYYRSPEVAVSLDRTKLTVTTRSRKAGSTNGCPDVYALEMSFVDRHYMSRVNGVFW